MTLLRRAAVFFAAAAVLFVYFFFATVGTMKFGRSTPYPKDFLNPGAGYYTLLAEGFRQGDVSLAIGADPRLQALENPYDFTARQREGIVGLWDASYYRGKYYLYFTPLPALLFYLPFRLLTGYYPDDAAAALFFSAWAFVMAALFLQRAFANRRAWLPVSVWIIFAGFANVVPFLLTNVRVYEVAALAGMAFSATWCYSLLRLNERPSLAAAAWMGFWLGLSITARPNLILLILPSAAAFFAMEAQVRRRAAIAACVALAGIALAAGAYNAARFGDPLENGHRYQMSFETPGNRSMCRLCTGREALRFWNNGLHYLFASPRVWAQFPYLEPEGARLDPTVSWPGNTEEVIGVAAIAPLALIGTAFAALLMLSRRPSDGVVRTGAQVMAGGWLILLGLSTCWWIVSRYSLDFMLLLALGTAVSTEAGLELLEEWGVRVLPLRVLVLLLAMYTIVVSILLGFEGRLMSFRMKNPDLYKAIGNRLGLQIR